MEIFIIICLAFYIISQLNKVKERISRLENNTSSQKKYSVTQSPVETLEEQRAQNNQKTILETTVDLTTFPLSTNTYDQTLPQKIVLERKFPQGVNYPGKNALSLFFKWFAEDWMLKTGALLLLAGIGWFVTYAILQNWIGPVGRVTLAYLVGISIMTFGWIKMHKPDFVHKAAVFFVLGATIILLTTYIARLEYDMFVPALALLIMYITSMFVSLSGIRFLPNLGIAGLIMASVAPLLTQSSMSDYILLFAYLLVVILGSHIVVHMTGKRESILAGLIITFLYSAPYLMAFINGNGLPGVDKGILLLFAYAFTAIFFLASIVGMLRSDEDENSNASLSDTLTAGGTALYLLLWVMACASTDIKAYILLAWSIVFSVGAFLVYKYTAKKNPFYVYSLASTVLLGTATSLLLHGESLIIAYTLEVFCLVLGSYTLLKNTRVTRFLSFAYILPVSMVVTSGYHYNDYFSAWAFSSYLLLFSMFLLAGIFYVAEKKNVSTNFEFFDTYGIAGSIVTLMIFNEMIKGTYFIWATGTFISLLILVSFKLRTKVSVTKMSFFYSVPLYAILRTIDTGRYAEHTLFDAWSNAILYVATLCLILAGIFFLDEKKKGRGFLLFNLYSLVSVLLVALMTWIDLSGSMLVIAYSCEAFLIILATSFVTQSERATKIMSAIFFIPIALSLPYLIAPVTIFMDQNTIALLLLSFVLLIVSGFVYKSEESHEKKNYTLFTTYLSVGSLYFWIVVWRSFHALYPDATGTIITLIIFTISGLIIFTKGTLGNSKGAKLYGSILVGFVLLRLLLVDVWSMTLIGKVITFSVVGALLMATAFIKKNDMLTEKK